jgi:hypothetical protein
MAAWYHPLEAVAKSSNCNATLEQLLEIEDTLAFAFFATLR